LNKIKFIFLLCLIVLQFLGCDSLKREKLKQPILQDYVYKTTLRQIRLSDGGAVDIEVAIRWRVGDINAFLLQFLEFEKYQDLVLEPKSHEIARKVANTYSSIDSIFTNQREEFVQEMKQTLNEELKEENVIIKEIILSDIVFPAEFTKAVEQVALKERKLEAIRQKNIIDLEKAEAAKKKAKADGEVKIKQAEMDGHVATINARTEEKKRLSSLARTETEALVIERKAKAEAIKQTLLNAAELEKQTQLKELDIQKRKDLDGLEIEQQKKMADLYATNPNYASFLISKELASKVQIAVLPVGTDTGILGGLLQNSFLPLASPPKTESESSKSEE